MLSQELTNSLLAVSALNKETALNTEQALDMALLIDKGTLIAEDVKNEPNNDEATGYRGATRIDRRPAPASLSLAFNKLKPAEAAFMLAYGFGSCVTVAEGSTGYKHTITPLDAYVDAARSVPTFTAAQRFAKLEKARYASGAIKGGKLSFAKNDWLKGSADVSFSGKTTSNYVLERITAAGNVTSLTLAANAVNGSTPPTRLDSISFVRAEVTTGKWVYVACSAVSAATPAVLTIAAPAVAATEITFEVCYIPTEAAWCSFPALVSESSLYITDLAVIFGGLYNPATGLVEGGKTLAGDLDSFEYTWSLENGEYEFRANGGGAYANSFLHTGMQHGINISRDYCDYLLRQFSIDATQFAVQARAVGAEYEAGHSFELRLCWPLCEVAKATRSADKGKLKIAADITPLYGNVNGAVIATVINQVATFAA